MFNQTISKFLMWYQQNIRRKPFILRSKHGFLFEFQLSYWVVKQLLIKESERILTDDPCLLAYLERTVKPGQTVFDVGAMFGAICMISGRLVGDRGKVFAFEAESKNYAQLCRNIELNRLETITPLHVAVYSSDGTITLNMYPPQRKGWHTIGSYELDGFRPVEEEQVKCVTLDYFCSERKIEKIDVMKIDIEGAEPEVFKGATGLLQSHAIRKIIFEISLAPLRGMGHTIDDVVSPLLDAGYKIYAINPDGTLHGPIDNFDEFKFVNLVASTP